jgi:hypothetical protein
MLMFDLLLLLRPPFRQSLTLPLPIRQLFMRSTAVELPRFCRRELSVADQASSHRLSPFWIVLSTFFSEKASLLLSQPKLQSMELPNSAQQVWT